MKRGINMLAEVMALPYSEYMFRRDPVRNGLERISRKGSTPLRWDTTELGLTLDEEGQYAAEYINRYTELSNLTELQSIFHYVFSVKDIYSLSAKLKDEPLFPDKHSAIANQYYIQNLGKLAKTFLTVRSGKAVLRYWDGPEGAYFNQREPLPHADTVSRAKTAVSHSFQPERIESWHSLLQCVPEDLILCSYAAALSGTGSISQCRYNSLEILKGFGDTACLADALLDKVLDKGMAETHIHAGASRSFGVIWESMLQSPSLVLERDYLLSFKKRIKQDDVLHLTREAATVRLLLAAYLASCRTDFFGFLDSELLRKKYASSYLNGVVQLCKCGHVELPFSCGLPVPGDLLRLDLEKADLWHILQLPAILRWSNPTLAERCFLTWSFLHVSNTPTDVGFTAVLLYYIRLKSTAYRLRVQDNKSKGLLYFQQFYDLSTDTGSLKRDEKLTQIIATALQDPRVLKTELRIKPAFSNAETLERARGQIKAEIKNYLLCFIKCHLYALFCMYSTGDIQERNLYATFSAHFDIALRAIRRGERKALSKLLRSMNVDLKKLPPHKIGLIYHMIKQGEQGEKPSCFLSVRGSSPRSEMEKYSFGAARFQAEAAIAAISDMRDLSPEIAGLIVGVDAASMEIPTEPWVFAPAFQNARARNAELAFDGRLAEKKQLLGVTYHVGEDFRHPLSGLRHIDEAIEYFRLHSGDRIGHGLALGIDLDRWFQHHGFFAIPRIEALENYLWVWSLLANDSMTRSIAPFTSLVESKIMDYANEIYGRLDGITIDSLYQAYIAKTWPTEELRKLERKWTGRETPECIRELDTAKFFPCCSSAPEGEQWNAENLILSYHCRFYKQRMNAPVMIRPTEDQLALTKELQLYLRRKIASIGIIIESNPSSNATVGEMDGILKHPASVLRDMENTPVLTSINTDDPSVFNATMANEHAHTYFALRTAGCSVESAMKVIDEMRETGLASSFIREVPPIEMLLQEYEAILRALLV